MEAWFNRVQEKNEPGLVDFGRPEPAVSSHLMPEPDTGTALTALSIHLLQSRGAMVLIQGEHRRPDVAAFLPGYQTMELPTPDAQTIGESSRPVRRD